MNEVAQSSQVNSADFLYLAGRYKKLRRGVSQTPFVLRTGQVMAETSVEEILFASVKEVLTGDSMKFIPAGREDMDVRMLGEGRPFAIEIKNPSRSSLTSNEIETLSKKMMDSCRGVMAVGLHLAKRDVILKMKTAEEDMHKTYKALVWISTPVISTSLETLNGQEELIVHQQTPARVAHRRANLVREKVVHWMKTKIVEKHDQYFVLEICTSAGCYIKEFISGDFGRTYPSVAELLNVESAHCFALDVVEVALELESSSPKKKPKLDDEVT